MPTPDPSKLCSHCGLPWDILYAHVTHTADGRMQTQCPHCGYVVTEKGS